MKNCDEIRQNHRYCEIISAILAISVIIFLIYLCVKGIIDNVGNSFVMYLVFAAVIIFLLVMLKVVIQLLLRIFKKREIVCL
jgi:ABC-type transport system involved in multi-copper enzyme maturation permease subunit